MNVTKVPQLPVARLPNQVGANPLSLAHQAPPTGFLSVLVAFLGEPVEGLAIEFKKSGDDGKPADKISEEGLKTDAKGCASLKDPVEVSNYWCVIEYQTDPAPITTVDEIKNPLTIPLPVGRPRRIIP